MSFASKFAEASARTNSLLCVGLDPEPSRLPGSIGGDVARFLQGIVEATADIAACYKPNLAFFEALGRDGYTVLGRVLDSIPRHTPVIGDAKRGDIGNTATAYAKALFQVWDFDAATVNPWGGEDCVRPFTDWADRGVFLWCRGSNPGAGDFQDLRVSLDSGDAMPLYEAVAARAHAWNDHRNIGLVAGATYPEQTARLRDLCPEMLLLLPGIGAQGGDTGGAVRAALDTSGGGFIVNTSRGVLYASNGDDWAEAARAAAIGVRDEINRHRAAR